MADSVPPAALPLLERPTPLERAVSVLREVFGFPFPEVAEPSRRQLAVRARRHLSADSVTVLSDSDSDSDGGGKAPRPARPVEGAASASRLFGAVFPKRPGIGVTAEPRTLNGGPGVVFRDAGEGSCTPWVWTSKVTGSRRSG